MVVTLTVWGIGSFVAGHYHGKAGKSLGLPSVKVEWKKKEVREVQEVKVEPKKEVVEVKETF